jgi:hypothetical protein
MFDKTFSNRQLFLFEFFLALFFSFIPLLYNNPYRLNIFLSWEGAYRLSLGQIPFRDFSLPMGYGYWVIPALFFKIFGPSMYSLITAQAFINLISILTFRSILKLLNIPALVIFLSVLVFCFSYVSFNFWPWYNHSVIVFELIAIYFTLLAIFQNPGWKVWASLATGAFFAFFAVFTKQDAGGFTVIILYLVLTYNALIERSMKLWVVFTAFLLFVGLIFILPLLPYDFLYWFNYGQQPHYSRLVPMNLLNQIIGWAYWEKFFLFIIMLMVLDKIKDARAFFLNKKEFLFAFLCVAIIIEAMVIQVTSNEPPKGEVFFYAFGFAYCLANLRLTINLSRWYYLVTCVVLIIFWWSGIYWRNIQRVFSKRPVFIEKIEDEKPQKYRLVKEYKTLKKLYLAESTLEGIKKIKDLGIVKNKENLKVLNMSELTSLAYEIPFTPLTNQPMWFHQDVSIFQKEVDEFCEKIKNKEYDLVLFESIPVNEVINFYPEDVKKCLIENYKHEFTFLAPRTPEESYIDVFTLL